MEANAIVTRVIEILKAEFPVLRSMALAPETPLLSAGLLDSFAIVLLISTLEGAFTIDIDVDQIQLEQFESPATIASLCLEVISKKRGGAPDA